MHRLILAPKGSLYVDHRNHNKLDNRKKNLREATNSENQFNRKTTRLPCTGVSWHKLSGKWRVRAKKNQQEVYLGLFSNKKKAMEARRNFLVKEGVVK